jgi:hypothetical protein
MCLPADLDVHEFAVISVRHLADRVEVPLVAALGDELLGDLCGFGLCDFMNICRRRAQRRAI